MMFSRSEYATEMKLAVLYLLNEARIRLTGDQIVECLATDDMMNYFDTMQSLASLADAGLVYVHNDAPVTYSSSARGKMLLGEFRTHIPASVRDTISEYVRANLLKLRRENEHPADYSELPGGQCTTVLQARDDDTELIISLTAADKAQAEKICTGWRDKAGDIYAYIVETLLCDDGQE